MSHSDCTYTIFKLKTCMVLPENLNELITFDEETGRVSSREGKHCEFKETFDRTQIPKYLKTLSAFSNADGGKIIFGVSDAPRVIVGVNRDNLVDVADITNRLLEYFDPEISFETKDYLFKDLSLYVIATPSSSKRPVICKRGKNIQFERRGRSETKELLAEGAIYYRYSAKSDRIKFSELQAIIEDREHKKIQNIIETLKLAEKVGFDRLGFLDAKDYGREGKTTDLFVTKETAKSMNFIDEGHFVEKAQDGAPAYYVMGKVNLKQVVVAALPDEDKNLLSEVADIIRPDIHNFYGANTAISAQQIGKILEEFDLTDMPYFQEDAKISRKYVTRQGIEAIHDAMRQEPLRFLRSFSSKPNIAAYEATLD